MDKAIGALNKIVGTVMQEVPIYRQLYGDRPSPSSLREFQLFPTTSPTDFLASGHVGNCIRRGIPISTIWPPHSANAPTFPFAVPRSAHDMAIIKRRVESILTYIGARSSDFCIFLTDHTHMYFSTELADLISSLNIQCEVRLISRPFYSEFLNEENDERRIIWLANLDDIPNSLRLRRETDILVTFGRQPISPLGPTAFHVITLDELPLFALHMLNDRYELLSRDLFLERDGDGEIIATELIPSIMPLIRYRTRLRISLPQ